MLKNLEYLKSGNKKQRKAFKVINQLNIIEDLKIYSPILCGTIPLRIDTASSDLDIIMEVHDFSDFRNKINFLYGSCSQFKLKQKIIRSKSIVKANFIYDNFQFELFGQAQAVTQQYAYLHMVIEKYLLDTNPSWQCEIIALKEQGFKTEQAFCHMLELTGDPFEALIDYGQKEEII
ncbi:DUF4269 domain-containing protein [Oceanobacillus neutriphilus]|uniref:Alpha/beta hydrolase n=1 Tax=Oceanobacillus neutriphilus TaxID=531815 RepID=A0ABQ2NNV1_9BACI|nr:DUF4269 domain-containing protein [Oceanobacillus neutriphilus]GGP08073.1 alpha/beta hydrolase [Oceanobacillus neutriphilus]